MNLKPEIGLRLVEASSPCGRGDGIRVPELSAMGFSLPFLDLQHRDVPGHFIDWNSGKHDLTVVLLQKKRQSAAGSATSLTQIRSHFRAMSAVNYLPPFAALLNAESLEIQPNTGGYVKYIRELDRIYADEDKFQQLLESRGDDIAYRVNELRFTERGNDLITGISVLNPGKVGSEFFMTRGHLHQRADRPETYYCLSGHGILLMEDLAGKVEAAEMRPGSLVYVPPFWVHRSVNIGSEIFATLFSIPLTPVKISKLFERHVDSSFS